MPAKNAATVTPCLSYRDAPAAIEWLGRAFGFEQHLVVPGEGGTIVHAQLVFGNGMVMLSSSRDEDATRPWQKTVAKLGGTTVTMNVFVADPDAHHARAVAAGAKIIHPLADQDHGGRGYGCQDLEGQLWFFGSYDPWASTP